MKTRNYIGKAISSIVNLNRYKNLINELFDRDFEINNNDNAIINNNYLHGVLDIMYLLVEKNNIFNFISFEEFILKTNNFTKYRNCPLNISSLIRLLLKIYYKRDIFTLNSDQILVLFQVLTIFVESGINSQKHVKQNETSLLLPGVHELTMNIGEAYCVLIEINYQQALNREMTNLAELLKILIEKKIEYSINLVEGASRFLTTKNNKLEREISKPIFELLKFKCFDSIINHKTIDNYLNLKSVKFLLK